MLKIPPLPPGAFDLTPYESGLDALRSYGRVNFLYDLRADEYVIRVETDRTDHTGPAKHTIKDRTFRVVYEPKGVYLRQKFD